MSAHESNYTPTSRIGKWFDERLPVARTRGFSGGAGARHARDIAAMGCSCTASVEVAQGFATPAKAGSTVCSVRAAVTHRIDLVQ